MNWTLGFFARPTAVMALLAAGAALMAGLGVAVHAGGMHAAHFVAVAGPPPDPDPEPNVAAAGPPPVIVEEDEWIAGGPRPDLAAANPPPDPSPVDS